MRKIVFSLVLFGALLVLSADEILAQGRLNFMLTNLTDYEIAEVYIAPSAYPDYSSENLLQTELDPQTRIYIGPNYYGDQSYWNITIVWTSGYKQIFTRRKLTRYNSYVVWDNYAGVHMRQSYERAFARYNEGPAAQRFGGGQANVDVTVSVPEKVNVANNYASRDRNRDRDRDRDRDYDNSNDRGERRRERPNDEKNYAKNDQPPQQYESRTRDLVFDEEDEEEDASRPVVEGSTASNVKGEAISVKATVELTRDGKTSTVLPTEPFKSGDKVRLLFSSNLPGFVYWLSKGTSGQYQVLFPNSKSGQNNAVVKNTEYTVPSKGAWRFDDTKGTEVVVCILAPEKIDVLEEAIKMADSGNKAGASELVASLVDAHENKRTTRDLVFEEEDDGDVNTKTQVTEEKDPFVAIYELEHI
ncbi:MAG: DUF4384 domain-containing protein [Deltaproteobacteria bacterium]|jgi:hypothetical protein|nr:DUF4384 domain-containing protein [Deltaproteobacteria bacterium]